MRYLKGNFMEATNLILAAFGAFTFAAVLAAGVATVILVAYFNQRLKEIEREYEAKIDSINAKNNAEIQRLNGQIESLQAIVQKFTGIDPNEFAPKGA